MSSICKLCGAVDQTHDMKVVRLVNPYDPDNKGQLWFVYQDGYRFYVKPASDNPAMARDPISCLEFKHDDGPASELAARLFKDLVADR